MKKTKSLFFTMLLSTCLVGNVFAGGVATTTGTGFISFFSDAVNAVVSFFRGNECPPRQCTTCKPGGDNDPNDPNCRPTTN